MKKKREIAMYILGAIIVSGFFLLLFALTIYNIPSNNKEALNITIGALIGAFTSVVGFFYGSSLGSRDKNDMLNK